MKKYFYILIWILIIWSLYILNKWLFWLDEINTLINQYISLEKIYNISLVLAIIILINSFLNFIFQKLSKNSTKKSISTHMLPILNKVLRTIIWIFWIITIISNLWYDVKALLAWAWIGWLALALASQKTVANIFWAINVLINRPFEIWDKIKISTFEWEVIDIWFIYLRLKLEAWHIVLIPNETITSSAVENFSKKK